MVGQWWTPPTDLSIVGAAATRRRTTSTAWHNFSDQLRQELSGSLSPELQKGMAADSIREAFTWGADQAGDVAKTNSVISDAHHSAHQCVHDLNSRLETIAHDGKTEIQQIQESKDLPPVKLGKIVEVVMRCQQDANSAAAPSTQNVFEAVQTILDQRGIQVSARQFAQQHGIDTTRMLGSPNKETITEQVRGLLDKAGPPTSAGTHRSTSTGSRWRSEDGRFRQSPSLTNSRCHCSHCGRLGKTTQATQIVPATSARLTSGRGEDGPRTAPGRGQNIASGPCARAAQPRQGHRQQVATRCRPVR